MRLFHKDLIKYLPRQQLLGQWRECCCIAKNIKEKGTPNHILVNRIMNYPREHFFRYGKLVWNEMHNRGYKADWFKFSDYFGDLSAEYESDILFQNWHNDRYLTQCLWNLAEKHDCGGIPNDEWEKLVSAPYIKERFYL